MTTTKGVLVIFLKRWLSREKIVTPFWKTRAHAFAKEFLYKFNLFKPTKWNDYGKHLPDDSLIDVT